MERECVWGRDIYEYIQMCDQLGKVDLQNRLLGINGPIGIGKKYLVKLVCNAIQREFICVSYTRFIENSYSIIRDCLYKENHKPLLFYIEDTYLKDSNYTNDVRLFIEEAENSKEIKNCIFVFASTAIIGSNTAIDISFRVFRYGCLSLEEKISLAHNVICRCQNQLHLPDVKLSDNLIEFIINNYTKEAGINYLVVLIKNLYESIYCNKNESANITIETIHRVLGSGCYVWNKKISNNVQGIGMAWSKWGGEILPIQIKTIKGEGKVIYSGKIGNVMKESIEVVIQYLKLNYKEWQIQRKDIYKKDFLVSMIELDLFKDGASAGLAFLVKLICILKKIKFKEVIAFSGEVSLEGKVLRVGGLKEKICAAQKHDVKKIVLPKQSLPEYQTLPDGMKTKLIVYFIDDVSELIKIFIKEQED